MLTPYGCTRRRERLWEKLDPKPDWIVIADPEHLIYFANFAPSPFLFRSTNAGAMLLLSKDRESILVADNLVKTFADAAHVDRSVTPTWYNGSASAPHREAFLAKSAIEAIEQCAGLHWGLEMSRVPVAVGEALRRRGNLSIANVDPVIHEMKRSKDDDELALMRRSAAAAEAGHAAAMRRISPGMSELDAFNIVQRASQEAAGMQAMVYGDFVSGPRCEKVGGPPTERIIKPGDLFLLDFSVIIGGYRADFANTFVVGGKATERQRFLHQSCLDAMAAGEGLLAAGRSARAVDKAVRDSFAAKGLLENFHHHSGHGLGLGHPDPPYIVPESEDVLVAGDVVTLEPGQYIAGVVGMRFERNYLITESGYETLTHHELTLEPSH